MEFYQEQSNFIMNKFTFIVYFIITLCTVTSSQDVNFKGQLNSWISINPGKEFNAQGGLRYIPTLNVEKQYNKLKFDTELSINTYGTVNYSKDSLYSNGKFKPYRLWLRISSEQIELRIGLQKINFGSATILRPLMWFDQMDPRDPLQLTDGVYGLLVRYYFLNNANIWLWGLYGNKNTKGWEFAPSNKNRPEFGGRIQYPILTGELALSYHNREVEFSQLDTIYPQYTLENSNENRLGIDGKWDIGIGLWFESVLKYQDIPENYRPWQQQLNLGFDYTFAIGNGLNIINEFLWAGASTSAFEFKNGISFSSLTLNYPVGLLDNISTIIFYNWTDNDWYRFINWQRTYDKISLYLMLFWNPDEFNIYQNLEENNLFAGKGFQFMFVFNH